MEHRATFNTVAKLYRDARPGYPDTLIEDVIAFAALEPGDGVLEVGCGAGQATESFAGRGFELTALDPGDALIAATRERLGKDPHITYLCALYEHQRFDAGKFRLIFSAQPWHWIPAQTAFPKAADELGENGVLAIFAHVPMPLEGALARAFENTYRRHLGSWGAPGELGYLPSGPVVGLFDGSKRFGPVTHKAYAWSWAHTAQSYVAFARTRSDHVMLPEKTREPLLCALAEVIKAEGDRFDWPYESHLYMARKR